VELVRTDAEVIGMLNCEMRRPETACRDEKYALCSDVFFNLICYADYLLVI
jgi:hypothetical protein